MTNVLLLTGNVETSQFTTWEPKKDRYYQQIRDAVGGCITLVYQDTGLECYGNDNGLIENLPQNESVAYFLEELQKGLGCQLYWGPFVIIFTGRAKQKTFQKAQEWFEKYKANSI